MLHPPRAQVGLGQYFRGGHELLLFGVKGRGLNVRTEARNIPSVLFAPRAAHSRKPPEFYELIERRSRGPYLEVFCRGKPRRNWTGWGNEVQA